MNKIIPALFLCITTSSSFAICHRAMPEVPEIPSGALSSLNEMYQAQQEVKKFVKTGEEVLECTDGRMTYFRIYNTLTKTAEAYNRELQAYRNKLAQL